MPVIIVQGKDAPSIPILKPERVCDLAVVERMALFAPGAEAERPWRRQVEARMVFDAGEVSEEVDLIYLPPHVEGTPLQLDYVDA